MGFKEIITIGGCDPFNSVAVHVARGAQLYLNIHRWTGEPHMSRPPLLAKKNTLRAQTIRDDALHIDSFQDDSHTSAGSLLPVSHHIAADIDCLRQTLLEQLQRELLIPASQILVANN